jgi:hypothetical protein
MSDASKMMAGIAPPRILAHDAGVALPAADEPARQPKHGAADALLRDGRGALGDGSR